MSKGNFWELFPGCYQVHIISNLEYFKQEIRYLPPVGQIYGIYVMQAQYASISYDIGLKTLGIDIEFTGLLQKLFVLPLDLAVDPKYDLVSSG